MKTTIIVAVAADGAIGDKGDLIWHLSADLRHFKELTMGHAVVMGRRTWESLPKGALPGRRNIVVTRNPSFDAPGAVIVNSVEEAVELCRQNGEEEMFIIGGATLYAAALPWADVMEITEVDAAYPNADTRFPSYDTSLWRNVRTYGADTDARSGLSYVFKRLERR